MKHVKKVFTGLSVAAAVLVAFSFTHTPARKPSTVYFFHFQGSPGQEHDPSFYSPTNVHSVINGPNIYLAWIAVDASEVDINGRPMVNGSTTISSLITTALTMPKRDVDITSPFQEHVELQPTQQ